MSTIKNYGVAGVASDVQLGKKGGRFIYDSANGVFKLTAQDGTTASSVQIADAVEQNEATSLSQVESLISNIDPSNISGLGTMSEQDASSVAITGGTINGTTIGGTTAAAGSFTTIDASTSVTAPDGTFTNAVNVDTINENTADVGVTADGVLLKDSNVTAGTVNADTISENTTDNGVVVDGVTLKDGGMTTTGDVTIGGDLTVQGETTVLDVTNLSVEDQLIELNSGFTGTGQISGDSGIFVNRGDNSDAQLVWDDANQVWRFEFADGTLADLEANLTSVVGAEQGGFGTDISAYGANSLVQADGSELAVGSEHQVLTVGSGGDISYEYVNDVRRSSDGKLVVDTTNATSTDAEYLDMASSTGSLTLSAFNEARSGDVDLVLAAQNNGEVIIGDPNDPSVLSAQSNESLTVTGGDSDDSADAGDLILNGGDGTNTYASGDVILQGGTGGSAEGITVIRDSAGNDITRFDAGVASATDYSVIENGIGDVSISAAGGSTDIDMVLSPKGAGVVLLPASYDISSAADEAVANKGYVDSQVQEVANNVDPKVLRATFTADSTATSFNIGTMPSVSGKTYYVKRVMLNVTTDFSGNSIDHVVVGDGTNTLVAEPEADIVSGTYFVDLSFANATSGGSTISATFNNASQTAVAPTAGAVTAVVEYEVL
ncbi:hypothetical protein PBI_SCTP2_537 [Salicola phage SCTP-2]|nr:hypothetical protein PBI_SCTP2_537 [Salicola phage SCTP-2]